MEQGLSHYREEDNIIIRWLRIDKERDQNYTVAYFECFDEGNDNFLDIYGFPLLNPDEPFGVLTQFDNIEDALTFSATAYEASNGKYVSAGMIQEKYHDYQGTGTDVIANENNHLTAPAVLDGFTITGCAEQQRQPSFQDCNITGNNPFSGSGGGVSLNSSDSQFTNCIISNSAFAGGGVFSGVGSASFINCIISNNTSSNNAGGVFILTWAELVTFTNCVIRQSMLAAMPFMMPGKTQNYRA